jgi:N-acetylmuramoyl-L-alanine amidase
MMIGFVADSRVANAVAPSPNHDERLGRGRPDMIVMHYTGMLDAEAALARLCAPDSKVSAHYVVFEDGRIVQCVPEARRAWHAGISSWEGEGDINSRSIGIEICNPGHDFGAPEFADAQIAAVIALGRDILARRVIRADRVVGHSDVAPGRKNDPGEKFPWSRLHAAGIGHWVEPVEIDDARGLALGDEGSQVLALQRALAAYGYGVAATERYDAATRDVVVAFQRHFRPSRVDGIADRSTIATLHRLRAARDGASAAVASS